MSLVASASSHRTATRTGTRNRGPREREVVGGGRAFAKERVEERAKVQRSVFYNASFDFLRVPVIPFAECRKVDFVNLQPSFLIAGSIIPRTRPDSTLPSISSQSNKARGLKLHYLGFCGRRHTRTHKTHTQRTRPRVITHAH